MRSVLVTIIFLAFGTAYFLPAFNDQALSVPVYEYGELSPVFSGDASYQKSPEQEDVLGAKESVVFVGDIMLGRHVETLSLRHGYSYPYEGLDISLIASNAAVVGNFESSIAVPHRRTPIYTTRFSTNPYLIPDLRRAGFTHVSLANNHSLDYGDVGYVNTKSLLDRYDLSSFGHGSILSTSSVAYISSPKGTIALIGINIIDQQYSQSEVTSVFNEASTQSEFQIAYVHFGTEYALVHSEDQKQFSEQLVQAGADLVIGHHPHVVQDVDIIEGVLVFYSLGNYIFDQYFSAEVQEGLVLVLEVTDNPLIRLVPVESISVQSQPRLMSDLDRKRFLTKLANRSNRELQTFLTEGKIPLGALVATSTKIAMIDR